MPEPTFEIRHTAEGAAAALRADVVNGLTATEKWLPPKWFYDDRGSELFEQITQLPEYYPARAEREILATRAPELAALTRAGTLVELGSGSSEKTRLLLDACRAEGSLAQFVPLDVSEQALRDAAHAIAQDYPGLAVHGIVGDFTEDLAVPAAAGPRLLAFLGGTIGNLVTDERAKFLTAARDSLEPGEWLLLGADLVKEPDTLVRAYDDAAGVTAEFNKNVLRVLNSELDATFDPEAFTHRAVWDGERSRIEMRLRATQAMRVSLPAVSLQIDFAAGEELRTEVSAKFRKPELAGELSAAGFELQHWWTDEAERFAVALASAGH